jgi:hypothetical protein
MTDKNTNNTYNTIIKTLDDIPKTVSTDFSNTMKSFDSSVSKSSSLSSSISPSIISISNNNNSKKGLSAMTWTIIILILAFFGLNIFKYLAGGTQVVSDILGNIMLKITTFFSFITLGVFKQTIDTVSTGINSTVNATQNFVNSGVNNSLKYISKESNIPFTFQSLASNHPNLLSSSSSSSSSPSSNSSIPSLASSPSLNRNSIQGSSKSSLLSTNIENKKQNNDSLSSGMSCVNKPSKQLSKSDMNLAVNHNQTNNNSSCQNQTGGNYDPNDSMNNKSNWCFIGEQNNVRTCASVSSSNLCMSGDIFPSQEMCVNPNLRT